MTHHINVAVRTLARRRGLAAGRAITVTVVVTAVTAVFTVANATFLRPLPFPHADRLMRVYLQPPGTTDFSEANPLDPFEFVRFRGRTATLEAFEGIWVADRAVAGDGEPDTIRAGRVSAGFFSLLGGRIVQGRAFTDRDADAGEKLVVVAQGLSRRRFGPDRAAIGRTLLIDREPHLVIGVMQAGFEPAFTNTEFWTPLTIAQGAAPTLLTAVQSVALLKPGTSRDQARHELDTMLQGMQQEAPALLNGWTIGVVDLREAQYGSRRAAILMLLAAVGALALIAIANLANLTLADVTSRRRDFSMRAALGASRLDLAWPEIVQSLVIAAAGGVGGLAIASWLVPALLALDPSSRLSASDLAMDWRVAGCGFVVAVAVMLAAVAAPVLRVAGPAVALDVSTGARRAIGDGVAQRVSTVLVGAQTVLAVVLLSSAALVVTAMQQAAHAAPGFEPSNVVTAQLRLSGTVLPTDADRANFVEQVVQRVAATPGIGSAGTTLNPFTVGGSFQTMVYVEDQPRPDGQPYTVQFRRVSPGYFETMGIRLLGGRSFTRQDGVDTQPVAMISASFARRFWPDQDPLGRRIKRGATAKAWSVIVGVVDDVRDVGLDQPVRDTVYSPYFQASNAAAPVGLVVRTVGSPADAIKSIQRAVWAIDAKQPLGNITTLEQFMHASLGPQRFRAMLVTVCGVLGLLLATVGTYGVTARSVVERRREVGIRLALGGRACHVWWAVAKASLTGVAAGAAGGLAASAAARVVLGAMLPELKNGDWTFTAVAAVTLVLVGGLAVAIAARGVTSVDPLRAIGD